ncbi:SET and MYND domain-containing protein 4-like [Wyeomyia smithii]|uniref:SET and MYND domain-containing protein 4-like n=1 Tax=Wyeomyia smithii TaxID=174621 RepID=UPI002467CD73|nr:SET and MYND domain-containing protein 4-like [Wyeomyia smithii]
MIRPELVQQLACPSFGLATSWIISRKGIPAESLDEVQRNFRRELWPFSKSPATKDNTRAKKLREQANECYRKPPTELDIALRKYNESISHAVDGSEDLALGYANRSAVYFNRKQYHRCIRNIELAKANGYPKDKMEKLLEREKKCLAQLKEHDLATKETQSKESTYDFNISDIPGYGRGLTASKDFKVGDVVLREHPVLVVLEPEVTYTRCAACGVENEFDLIPCKHCVLAMYCSEKCRLDAYELYHRYECEIMQDLAHLFRGPKPTRMFLLTLRLFWLVMTDLMKNPADFMHRFEKNLNKYRDPRNVNPTGIHLHVLSNPRPNMTEDRTGEGVSQFLTVLIYNIAIVGNSSIEEQICKDYQTLLLDVLYRLMQQAKQICDQSMSGVTCYYPFLQLVNHSCAPNTERFTTAGLESCLVTKRPILAGEQITMCYFPNGSSDVMSKDKRQTQLQKEFSFTCHCLGCTLDYPLLSAIEENTELQCELQSINTSEESPNVLRALEDFIQRHDNQYPQKELAQAWSMYRERIIEHL